MPERHLETETKSSSFIADITTTLDEQVKEKEILKYSIYQVHPLKNKHFSFDLSIYLLSFF